MSRNLLFIAIAVLGTLALQLWLSHLSYQSFAEGNLLLGLFLFLGVPALAILIALYFAALRRRSPQGANRKEGQKNP